MDERQPVIENGALIFEQGIVKEIGRQQELAGKGRFDLEIGGGSYDIALPGLINAHHHVGRYFRDGLSDLPLELWLFRLRQQLHLPLTYEESYDNTLWSCLELIRGGVTAVIAFHSEPPGQNNCNWEAALQAYRDSGLRVAFCTAAANQNRFVYADDQDFLTSLPKRLAGWLEANQEPFCWESYLRAWRSTYKKYDSRDGKVRVFLAPSGTQWCSDELLSKIKSAAREFSTGIQLHLLETRYQREYGLRKWGKSLVAHLAELGLLGPEVSCAHSVWLEEADFKIMAESGATAVHNPSSNLRLGSGISPVAAMAEAGVNLALGLDGLGLNDNGDMLTDMRLAMFLQRTPGLAGKRLSPKRALELATKGGARAILQGERLGRLAPGYSADIVLLDGRSIWSSPFVNPDNDFFEVLLVRGRADDIKAVIIGGEPVMNDKELPGIDVSGLSARLAKLCQKRQARMAEKRALVDELEGKLIEYFLHWDKQNQKMGRPWYRYNLL
jgi:cytosine/adenosine deaminase-related metal-dependent hydrolase